MSLFSKSVAIVYHSPYGHTAKVANFIADGAQETGVQVHMMNVEHIDWDVLDAADAIVFRCPTYMGSLTSAMKLFMEQSSKRWLARSWQCNLAAAFGTGGRLSGAKLAVLQQINLFAMQHGMLVSGLPLMPTGRALTGQNRMLSILAL